MLISRVILDKARLRRPTATQFYQRTPELRWLSTLLYKQLDVEALCTHDVC